jgi:glycosyltransferase involved in cell wall biosynthesis
MPCKRVTVVHTVASLMPHSGVTPVILDFMRYRTLAALPSRCVSFDAQGSPPPFAQSSSDDFIAVAMPAHPWSQFSAFGSALEALVGDLRSQGQTVIIHDHGLWLPSNLAASKVAARLQCPYVISPHGMLQPRALAQTSFKKRVAWFAYEKRRLRGADFLHVTSPLEADAVAALLPTNKLVLMPLGIELPAPLEPPQSRRQEIIYLGRLHPLKGISILLQAWQLARQPGWGLQLIGPCDDVYQQQLTQEIANLQIGDTVSFAGPLYGADKDQALLQSAVLVLPSFTENFGMVVVEALAHGLPVITTEGTPWRQITEKACGWVTPPQAQSLADALRSAMNTPMLELGNMGERGRAWMQSSFDLTTLTSKMNQHYLELTSG